MAYQVLARKWRPKNFREMVGQEHVLQALINALDNQRLHHAYLFTGTRGVGKTTIARILAKCLNCEAGVSSQPCGECSSCLEIAEGRSVDLLEVDAASRTKVEDTRELLENVQYAPTRSRYKVYLIDEVHMLSSHSFNALLKTLEEPPEHVKFLLATTDPQKLPATVLSRCLQFNLKNMPPEQIVSHLGNVLQQESVECEESALWLLARAASGSMRDAMSLTDQAIAFGSGSVREADVRSMLGTVDMSFVYQLLEAVSAGEPSGVLECVARMAEHAPDFVGSLDEMLSLLHRVALAQAVPDAIDNSWGDAQRVAELARQITGEDAQLFYQLALNGKRDIALSPDPRTGFEMVLLRMLAFRPVAAFDPSLESVELQEVPSSAPEGGVSVKKSSEVIAPDDPAVANGEVSAASPAVEVAPPSPAVTLGSDPWVDVLDQLGLVGILHNIASHCEMQHCAEMETGGLQLRFVLDEQNATLFNESHIDKLRQALESYLGTPITLSIAVGATSSPTPSQIKAKRAELRQQEAVAAIENDPQVQALIARFDAQLDHSSIVATDG